MKKYIIYTVFAVSVLLLSSCGSNHIKDPIQKTKTVEGYMFSEATDAILVNEYRSYNIKFKLTKDNFVAPGRVVRFRVFDPKFGRIVTPQVVTDENGNGLFKYYPPDIIPSGKITEMIQFVYEINDTNSSATKKKELVQHIALTFDFDANKSVDGRATTLSIAYETTECDPKRGIVSHYHVHAVDTKSNLPVVGIPIKMTLINGVKAFDGRKIHRASGRLLNSTTFSFEDKGVDFSSFLDSREEKLIDSDDNLIILPSEGRSDASYIGGWDIQSVANKLILSEWYANVKTIYGLTYMIGSEHRLLGGENGGVGRLANAHIEAVESTTDADGYAYFDIAYDAILSGHTVVVEAHGDENGRRIGVSKKIFLRLDEDKVVADEVNVKMLGGSSVRVPMHLSIQPTCVGSEPLIDVPIVNGSFSAEPGDKCVILQGSAQDMHSSSSGNVIVTVGSLERSMNDDNETIYTDCTIKWEGGPGSLKYEY